MSPNRVRVPHRAWRIVVAIELLLIGAVIGLAVASYVQNARQDRLCQLVTFAHGQVQRGIATNSQLVIQDMRKPTRKTLADAVIRRDAISDATTALISINRARC